MSVVLADINDEAARLGASALPGWDTLRVMGRILIVEDEADLNDLIARQLRQEGHEVYQAYDGLAGLQTVESTNPDLVILDWMLPKLDGLAVARRIRERHVVPILMLTARGEETDVVLGLEVGADDYLTKPFRIRELLARVRAILRRVELHRTAPVTAATSEIPAVLEIGPITLSLEMRTANIGDEELELTPKEFDLLTMFVQNPGRAFSRDYLLERVWGDDVFVTDRTVDTHVQRLRKKLGDHADLIRTVWGIGYKLQREA
ncbi:MAG: two-component system, OmpR family, response regulator [Thermomicrobiales bacterium]|nr:two-component system, OmpR family, response regulator [Thermomicrobiales bacterium]